MEAIKLFFYFLTAFLGVALVGVSLVGILAVFGITF